MEEIANAQQKRLYEGLRAVTDERTAREIALRDILPKGPSDRRREGWAREVCAEMERRLPKDDVLRARMACHCQPPLAKFERLRRAYTASGDLSEYVRMQNETEDGAASFWLEDGAVYMRYPRCYCSFVKRAERPIPLSWCYCTVGYAKALHDYVFGCDTRVELLESVISGGEQCVMRVTLPGETDTQREG